AQPVATPRPTIIAPIRIAAEPTVIRFVQLIRPGLRLVASIACCSLSRAGGSRSRHAGLEWRAIWLQLSAQASSRRKLFERGLHGSREHPVAARGGGGAAPCGGRGRRRGAERRRK